MEIKNESKNFEPEMNMRNSKDKDKRKKRNKNKNNRTNNYTKSMGGFSTPNVVTNGKQRDNDPAWYMNIPNISRDYASLPFSQTLGLPADTTRSVGIKPGNTQINVPGFMTIYFNPTIGMNQDGPTAAVNLAAQQIYTIDRKANSGASNYDKTDVMLLIMAMDSAYILYEDLLRAYRVISTYNGVNRYYPNAIIEALGYNPNLVYHLAEFRGILDVFAYKLASVNIPDQMDIIKRHSWMCSNIYLDDDNQKAQSYAFVPQTIYIWKEGVNNNPTYLAPQRIHAYSNTDRVLLDLGSITTLIDQVMNPILGSQDIGIITGDLAKAFGENGMIKIKPVEEYAALVPVFSQEVVLQIRNIFCSIGNITAAPAKTGNIEVVLADLINGPYLQQKLVISAADADRGWRRSQRPLLNFTIEDTSPENVLVATRLISLCGEALSGGTSDLTIYGTEVVVGMKITTLINGVANQVNFDQDMSFNVTSPSGPAIGSNIEVQQQVSTFNNAPVAYWYRFNNAIPPMVTSMGPVTNLCDYIFLDDDELKRIHEIAVMSLFTVKDYKLN